VSARRSLIEPDRSGDIAGVELSGRGDRLVCGGDDLVGQVDQSAPSWLRQRDQLIGRDLAGVVQVTPS